MADADHRADVHTARSFRRICTTLCGILVDVSGDEVVRVRGDREHPFSRGYTCPKGRSLPQMHHPGRIERPLLRVGDRLVPTSWDECLDDLAGRLRRGVVSVPHGHERANVNRLTDKDHIDGLTGTVQYSGIPVTLHPATGDDG